MNRGGRSKRKERCLQNPATGETRRCLPLEVNLSLGQRGDSATHAPWVGSAAAGARWVPGDELRPLLAALTTRAVKVVCGAPAHTPLFPRREDFAAVVGARRAARAVTMVKLSKEAKQRLQQLFKGGQFAIRWGFIPLVIYLGQWARNL